MTGQEKLKLAIQLINDNHILYTTGEPFAISVYDVPSDIRGNKFKAILEKLENQYNAIKIHQLPYDVTGHDYHPLGDEDITMQNSYIIEILDGYDDICKGILNERKPDTTIPEYIPHYIKIMFHAVNALKITDKNQPIKENIVEWIRENYPELGKTETEYLATFVRSPDRKKGGFHR